MAQYRTQTRIIADILTAARDMDTMDDGVGITTLVRRGNVSYPRLTRIVSNLVGAGLLVVMNERDVATYKISEKGINFLRVYREFDNFAQSFGLQL